MRPNTLWTILSSAQHIAGMLLQSSFCSHIQKLTQTKPDILWKSCKVTHSLIACMLLQDPFWERIQKVRQTELDILWKSFRVATFNSFLLNAIPTFVSVATFTTYVLLGNKLTAAKAFTSLSLFSVSCFAVTKLEDPYRYVLLGDKHIAVKAFASLALCSVSCCLVTVVVHLCRLYAAGLKAGGSQALHVPVPLG